MNPMVFVNDLLYLLLVTSVLNICDNLRDEELVELGIRLEDKKGIINIITILKYYMYVTSYNKNECFLIAEPLPQVCLKNLNIILDRK